MVRVIWLVFFGLVAVRSFANAIEEIELGIGDVGSLTCESCNTIQLSRKGVIQVVQSFNQKGLQLVALRSGTVLLSIPDKRRHVLVRVSRKGESKVLPASTIANKIDQKKYWLSVHLMQIKRQSADKRLALRSLQLGLSNIERLQSQISRMGYTAKTIALPGLVIIGGRHYHINSGGEQASSFRAEREWVHWKNYGFSLSLETQSMVACQMGLQYQVNLSKPHLEARESHLSRSEIAGFYVLRCDQESLVAMIDIESEDHMTEVPSLWGRVPIIGPLFSSKSVSQGFVQLALYMKIESQQ